MAVKYLLDADVPRALFTGLRREDPGIDVVRVQQVGLREASDPEILAFTAAEGRIVVTKDKATMSMELCRVNESSEASDWENVIRFIPPAASQ